MNTYNRILSHLQKKGNITSWEAIERYGCTRLSQYIYLLKKDGYIIRTKTETKKNRYGDKVSFTRYYLEREKDD